MNNRRSIKVEASQDKLAALIANDSSGWLQKQLQYLYDLLEHLMPTTMAPRQSNLDPSKFPSLHCDIWNRYSEKVCFLFLV
jgi:hypothetical protein